MQGENLTLRGTAVAASISCGVYKNFFEASENCQAKSVEVIPDPENIAYFEEFLSKYREFCLASTPLMHYLSNRKFQ